MIKKDHITLQYIQNKSFIYFDQSAIYLLLIYFLYRKEFLKNIFFLDV